MKRNEYIRELQRLQFEQDPTIKAITDWASPCCRASWCCQRRPLGRRPKCAFSATSRISREPADTPEAPWYTIRSDDRKKAQLNCISHLSNLLPVGDVPKETIKLPKRPVKNKYDPEGGLAGRQFIPEAC
jgi:hypothetical protein